MNEEGRLYDFSILIQSHPPDNAFIKHMLSLFLANMPVTTSSLQKACKEQNWEEVHFNAHKMKAGIDTFNITPLKSIIRKIEKRSKHVSEADIETIQHDVQLIDDHIKKCILAMQQEIKTL